MIANYHTHTYRCKHATGEDREYVEAAIQGGMKILGFSDHIPWIYDSDFTTNSHMDFWQIEDYFDSLTQLRDEYKHDITLYIGFEAEYIPVFDEQQQRILRDYPVDYMILGQHVTDRMDQCPYSGWETKDDAALIRYIDTIIAGMETGRFQYVAHPDLFYYTGNATLYEQQFTRLCEYLKQKQIPVEVNMLGLWQGRNYPCARFFEIAKKVGNTAIIGCDAHSPDRLYDITMQQTCESYAASYGLELVDILSTLNGIC